LARKIQPSSPWHGSGDETGATEQPDHSYFLPVPAGGGLEGGCFFGWEELLALACFCEDFFWFALGDLSPMVVVWLLG
jgi:hypothetical protein